MKPFTINASKNNPKSLLRRQSSNSSGKTSSEELKRANGSVDKLLQEKSSKYVDTIVFNYRKNFQSENNVEITKDLPNSDLLEGIIDSRISFDLYQDFKIQVERLKRMQNSSEIFDTLDLLPMILSGGINRLKNYLKCVKYPSVMHDEEPENEPALLDMKNKLIRLNKVMLKWMRIFTHYLEYASLTQHALEKIKQEYRKIEEEWGLLKLILAQTTRDKVGNLPVVVEQYLKLKTTNTSKGTMTDAIEEKVTISVPLLETLIIEKPIPIKKVDSCVQTDNNSSPKIPKKITSAIAMPISKPKPAMIDKETSAIIEMHSIKIGVDSIISFLVDNETQISTQDESERLLEIIRNHTTVIESLQFKNEILKTESQNMKISNAQEIDILKDDKKKLQENIFEINNEILSKSNLINDLENQYIQLKNSHETQLQALNLEYKTSLMQKEEHFRSIICSREFEESQAKIELQEKINETVNQLHIVTNSMEISEIEKEKMQLDIQKLNLNINAQEGVINDFNQKCFEASAEILKLNNQINNLEAENKILKDKNGELENTIESQGKIISEFEILNMDMDIDGKEYTPIEIQNRIQINNFRILMMEKSNHNYRKILNEYISRDIRSSEFVYNFNKNFSLHTNEMIEAADLLENMSYETFKNRLNTNETKVDRIETKSVNSWTRIREKTNNTGNCVKLRPASCRSKATDKYKLTVIGEKDEMRGIISEELDQDIRQRTRYPPHEWVNGLGGGGRYPYPKWVWSFYGGWWPHSINHKTNALITLGLLSGAILTIGTISANTESRHTYPRRWIPSMLFSRDFHDPAYVAMWKEQLKKEGREWIEPIPEWWPFNK